MKVLFKLFGIITIAVIIVFTMATCSDPHSHSFGDWETVAEANCTTGEIQERSCSCGHKETQEGEDLDPDNHDHKIKTSTATCTTAGDVTYVCDREGCDDEYDETGIELGHAFLETIPATCTTDSIPGTCTREACDEVNPEAVVPELGHAFATIPATCTTDSMPGTCTREGCDEANPEAVVPELGHAFSTTPATCITPSIPGVCTRGGCSIIDPAAVVSALGHAFAAIPATCTTNSIPGICTRDDCDEENTEAVISALGHSGGTWTVTNTIYPATSTGTCSRCSETTRTTQIGDIGPGGGIIFYIADGQAGRSLGFTVQGFSEGGSLAYLNFVSYSAYYLEAAPSNALGGENPPGTSTQMESYAGATDSGIGAGRRNTLMSLRFLGLGGKYIYSEVACLNYSTSTANDWFLPSHEELRQLALQRSFLELPGGIYWTSELRYQVAAWGIYDNSTVGFFEYTGSEKFYARPIRAF